MNKPVKTIFALIFIIIFNVGSLSFAHAASADTLINLANSSRAASGLADLTQNDQLTSAALAKANNIFSDDYFAHTSPSGKTPWDFIKAAGYDYTTAGENLSIGYTDDQELHDAWMASSSHRANIMNANFRDIGIAVVLGEYKGEETTVVVQMFGAKVATEAAEESPEPSSNILNAFQTETPTDQPAINAEPSFTLDKDKTKFAPTQIFIDEKVTFTVVLTGEPQKILITVGEQEINLMEAASIQQDGENKIYSKEVVIEKVGETDVILVVDGQDNQTEVQNLGTLKVAAKSIVKTSTTNATQNAQDFVSKNIIPISAAFALLILSLIIVLIYRLQKNGRLPRVDLLPKL